MRSNRSYRDRAAKPFDRESSPQPPPGHQITCMAGTERPLREYQRRIYAQSCDSNALVVLPTGSGKTRIAAQHIMRVCQEQHGKVLFLVPTRLLVDQQAASLFQDTGLEVRCDCKAPNGCWTSTRRHRLLGPAHKFTQGVTNMYAPAFNFPGVYVQRRLPNHLKLCKSSCLHSRGLPCPIQQKQLGVQPVCFFTRNF